jgi:DNA replication protein DnaC
MSAQAPVDAARLGVMLHELRLPTMKNVWPSFAERADKEGWPAARFLAAIAEHELAERDRRRIERHLADARRPPGKTLDGFDFDAVPMVSKAQVMALAAGDAWLARTCSCSARQAAVRAISPPASASPSSRTDGVSCSVAPPTSSSACRSPAAS